MRTQTHNTAEYQNSSNFNLAEFIISRHLSTSPDQIALTIIELDGASLKTNEWTYNELDKTIRSVAQQLKELGLKQGEHVLLRLENDAPFVFSFLGAIAAGLVPIPLSPKITDSELSFFIKDTETKWIIHSNSLNVTEVDNINLINEDQISLRPPKEVFFDYAKTSSEDPAFMIYSSGTSSEPKAILHAQRTILGRLPMREGWHDMQTKDRILHAGDFNWTYTLGVGLMDPWLHGAAAYLIKGNKTPKLWPTVISKMGITIFAAVPSLYRRILKYNDNLKADLTSLRHGLTAGEALSPSLHDNWLRQTNIPLYEALGQSEISTYASTSPHTNEVKGSKGVIQKNRKLAILPEKGGQQHLPNGEIGIIAIHNSDPGLMLRYWQREKEMNQSFRGEWFITGDLGSIDDQGNLFHHGRSDEIMNASGYRVSPLEVEASILQVENVSEAAVAEISISSDLNIIAAFIVLKNDKLETLKTLKAHLNNRLASYKHPKSLQIVDQLPRNQAGKLMRSKLVTLYKSS